MDCFGDSDGSIDILVSGGAGGYIYLWSTGATTQNIDGLTAGTYSVTVTDSENCFSSLIVDINEGDEIMLSTNKGRIIRCPVKQIRITGRNAKGNRIIKTSGEEKVATAFKVIHIKE